MSVLSWHRLAGDLTKQVRELQAQLAAEKQRADEAEVALAKLQEEYDDLDSHFDHQMTAEKNEVELQAKLAAVERERDRLREFCYECKHLDGWAWCREMTISEQREYDRREQRDHCHFTPSRWTARS